MKRIWVEHTVEKSCRVLKRCCLRLGSKKVILILLFMVRVRSFTGLRIGIGVVQGLAYGLSIPVVGVSSLACLAQQFIRDEGNAALVALTARNTEVYFGAYEKHENGVRLIGREGVFEAAEIPAQSDSLNWCGVGGGWAFEEALQESARVDIFAVHLGPKIKAADLLISEKSRWGGGSRKMRSRLCRNIYGSKLLRSPKRNRQPNQGIFLKVPSVL